MAVDPDDVQDISTATVVMYRDAELYLLRLIASYLAKGIDAPTWAEDRLAAVRDLRIAAEEVLGRLQEQLEAGAAQQVAEAYRLGLGAALTDLPEDLATRLAAQAASFATVTRTAAIESLATALVRDVGARHSNVLRHVLDVYRAVVARASAVAAATGITRRQASQLAYQRFVDQAVVSFTDSAGRTWRLSSYVEMALRTVNQRAAVQGQTDRLEHLGIPLVIISDSPGECELCRPWEGKVLSIAGGETGRVQHRSVTTGRLVYVQVDGTLAEARASGLFHPNCTHAARAFLPGATVRPKGDLSDPEHNKAKTRQREIERKIRGWKEREATALTPEAKRAATVKVRAWQGEMREHLDANPKLKRLRYREQIGAGNVPPPTPPPAAGAPRPRPPRPTAPDEPVTVRPAGPSEPQFELPNPPSDPPAVVDLQALTDDELADAFARLTAVDDETQIDQPALDAVLAEMDRRDAGQPEPATDPAEDPRDLRIAELVSRGWEWREAYAEAYDLDADDLARQERAAAIDAQRTAGETREQTVRRLYAEWVDLTYLQAEAATNGHMLNPLGVRTAGVTVRSLFSGPAARAAKYASPELAEWWSENGGRRTYAEFRAEQLGRASDLRDAARARAQGRADRDFGL